MQIKFVFFALSSTVAAASALCAEPSEGRLPTHCRSDEFAYLNAQMAVIEWNDKSDHAKGNSLRKNGKLLSLCADRQQEPLGRLTYRYGEIGKVEFENAATPESKFSISYQQDGPRGGNNIFSFHVGAFTYYVTEATGDGHGIAIHVFKAGKKLSYLFSGTDKGTDYSSGLFPINFDTAISPIFLQREPEDDIGGVL